MQVGDGSGGAMSEINVTPMIDVILVLLIIFMVMVPTVQMGYLVNVPPKTESEGPAVPNPNQIIIRYDKDGQMFINKKNIQRDQFVQTLTDTMKGNTGKMIFFAGDPEASYNDTVEFLDLARQSGAENIGIIVEDIWQPSETVMELAGSN